MTTLREGDRSPEVTELQQLLNKHMFGLNLVTDGHFGPVTTAAVKKYQTAVGIVADGVVGPVTFNMLRGGKGYQQPAVVAVVNNKKLTEADYARAAAALGVTVAHIKTVCAVEAAGSGFLSDGRVKILFERHYFYKRCTPDQRTQAGPDICNAAAGGYKGNGAEWERITRAGQVNQNAAYESASWGLFQIMGAHWKALGYSSVQEFVDLMKRSEGDQLDIFVRFIKADKRLHDALRACDWKTFARIYNGPAYAKNQYDVKLTVAYNRYSKA